MTNSGKNRREAESYSTSEAAALLGISTPTLKRMVEEGRLEAYRTPGGHLRIPAESVEAVKEHPQAQRLQVRDASLVLHNRRERLEELTIEAQEMRAKREVTKLQLEEEEESERREAQAQVRREDAARRQAELQREHERLALERAREEARHEREQAEQREKREAERESAAFRCLWLDKATEALSAYQYRWLSATQRKEILECLEVEIHKRQPLDEPRMPAIIVRSLEALIEPFRAERDAQEHRRKLTEDALRSLPYLATDAERVRATAAIREALKGCDANANESEMRIAVEEAVRPVRQIVQKRLLAARLIEWAVRQLPWFGRNEGDEARIRRECTEILAEQPVDISEAEGKEALDRTVRGACARIEKRQAETQRQARKASLIQQGVAEVSAYLLNLHREGELSDEDYWDSEIAAELRERVRQDLESELTGDETAQEVREVAHDIIDDEFDDDKFE